MVLMFVSSRLEIYDYSLKIIDLRKITLQLVMIFKLFGN